MTNESSSPNESPLSPRSRQPSTNCEEDTAAAAAGGVDDSPRSWHNASPSLTDHEANMSASSVDSPAAKLLNKRNSTNDQQIDKCTKRDERSKSCSNVVATAAANSICTTTSDLNESITASSISPASSSSNSIAISSVDNNKQSSASNSLKRSLDISSDAGSSDYSGSSTQAPPAKKMSYSIMNILGSGNGNNGKERENFSNKENAKNDNQSESNDYSSRSQSPNESAYQQRPSPPSGLQTSPRSASEASKNAAAMGLLMSNPLAAASGLHPSMAASLFQQHMNASSSSSATNPMANNFNSFLLSPILAAAAAAAQSGGNSSQQPNHASLLNNISNLAFLSGLNNLNGGAQSLNKPPTANPSDLWPWFNMAAVSALYGLDSKLNGRFI